MTAEAQTKTQPNGDAQPKQMPNGNAQPNGNASQNMPSLEDLIARYGDSSNTTWVEDKFEVWRHPTMGAAVGYAVSADDDKKDTFCVIWGNPLCEEEKFPEVIHAFLDFVKQKGWSPIWSCVDERVERVLAEELQWRAVACVQEDVLDPTKANPEENKEVRKHIRKAQKAGCTIIKCDGPPADDIKEQINECIAQWKAGRKGTQVHTTNVEPWRDTEHRHYFYAKDAEGKVVGFLFISKVAEGWAIKDSISLKSAPKNLTEWLITEAIHYLADKGESYLTFGPTPAPALKSAENAEMPSGSFKFLSATYSSIERTLLGNKRDFRNKFKVEGEPIYVCYPPHGLGRHGVSALMKVLTD